MDIEVASQHDGHLRLKGEMCLTVDTSNGTGHSLITSSPSPGDQGLAVPLEKSVEAKVK